MKDYEQMELDLTLEADRSLKDNVQGVTKFALGQIMRNDHPGMVRNRHEGYGIVSEYGASLRASMKLVENDMKIMLGLLPNGEGDFISACASLYNSAIETAVSAIKLAAQGQRILGDLYGSETRTPMDDYLGDAGEDGLAGEGSGFEDAGLIDAAAEELPEAMEDEMEGQ